MESEELFYPEISVAIGSYALQKGVEVEVYSDQNSYFDWAKIRFTPQFQENISVKKKEPGTVMLGYNRVLDTVFEGYVTGPYSGGGYMDEIVLKDKMLLLEETIISNTFLDVTPQEIISYCLAQAGVTETKLSAEIYQPRSVVSIAQKTSLRSLRRSTQYGALKINSFFRVASSIGERSLNRKRYITSNMVLILSLLTSRSARGNLRPCRLHS